MITLKPSEEKKFRRAYAKIAKARGLSEDPDDPRHGYDYRRAWWNGELSTDKSGHFTSKYKTQDNPRYDVAPEAVEKEISRMMRGQRRKRRLK